MTIQYETLLGILNTYLNHLVAECTVEVHEQCAELRPGFGGDFGTLKRGERSKVTKSWVGLDEPFDGLTSHFESSNGTTSGTGTLP